MVTLLNSRSGAVRPGTLLMLLSFLVVGGFLYWLSVTAEPTEVVVEEPEDDVVVNEVAFADFSSGPPAYVGQELTLRSVAVTSLLRPHAFWTNLADQQQTAYLLHLSDALLADSVSVDLGMIVDVTGTVVQMSDSILDAWEAAGAFPNDIDRLTAEFAETFIEVTVLGGDGAGDDSSEAGEASEPSS